MKHVARHTTQSLRLMALLLGCFVLGSGCQLPKASSHPAPQAPIHKQGGTTMPSEATTFLSISSPVFTAQGSIPAKYTCDGQNISPPLVISGTPTNAQSLALIVHDPDAPGGNWDHWLLWNIPAETDRIDEGSVPAGAVSGMNDFKQQAYGGPCPPSGTHRYVFTLYALDSPLTLPAGTKRATLERAMQSHILDQTALIGTYGHSKNN